MKKIVIRKDIRSIYACLIAIFLLFMFKDGDSYFNINNYKIGLFFITILGCFGIIVNWLSGHFKFDIVKGIIFFSCVSLFVSKYILDKKAEPFYILFIIFLLLYLFCSAEIRFSIENVRFLINAYILSSNIMGIIILVQHRTPYAKYGIFRWALYYDSQHYYDVNFTALYFLLPTLLAFYAALKVKRNKYLYMIATTINMFAILMLGSRGTFAPVIAIMLLLVLSDRNVSITKIAIIVAVLIGIYFFLPDDTVSRLVGTSYIGTEHKRYIDWEYGLKVFHNSPIWGSGMRAPKELVAEIGGQSIYYTIHNTYIVYLAQLGIIGSIPFFIILVYPLIELIRTCQNAYLFLAYCGILFGCLMIEANYSYVLIIPLSFIYMIISYARNNKICGKELLLKIFGDEIDNEES